MDRRIVQRFTVAILTTVLLGAVPLEAALAKCSPATLAGTRVALYTNDYRDNSTSTFCLANLNKKSAIRKNSRCTEKSVTPEGDVVSTKSTITLGKFKLKKNCKFSLKLNREMTEELTEGGQTRRFEGTMSFQSMSGHMNQNGDMGIVTGMMNFTGIVTNLTNGDSDEFSDVSLAQFTVIKLQ
ncbi:MAG: hypothetical protein AAF530_23155 [Pseudomonadota bacterium]